MKQKEIILTINKNVLSNDEITKYFLDNPDIIVNETNQTIEDVTFNMSNGDIININIDCDFFDVTNEIDFAIDLWNFYKNYNTELFKRVIFYYFEDLSNLYKHDDVLNFEPIKIIALLNDNK
jgi:hypothetical protein